MLGPWIVSRGKRSIPANHVGLRSPSLLGRKRQSSYTNASLVKHARLYKGLTTDSNLITGAVSQGVHAAEVNNVLLAIDRLFTLSDKILDREWLFRGELGHAQLGTVQSPSNNGPAPGIVMFSWRAMRTYQQLSKTTSETTRNTHIDHIIPLLQIDFQINAVRIEPNVVRICNGFIFSQFDEGKVKAPIGAWFEALERSRIELRQHYDGRG